MRLRRPLTVSTATVALLTVAVLPAGAHPYFSQDDATAPAGSLTTLTLAMAHGCGTEDEAGGEPTTEVSMEVPEAFSYLEPQEVDGYEIAREGDVGAVPEVVTWTATDGGVPAPEVTMDAVVEGAAGDEVYVRVFQGCDGFAYRWVGTPDDPADDPAVRLTLTEPDPDAPPPPPPTDADGAATDDTGADAEATDTDGATDADGVTDADGADDGAEGDGDAEVAADEAAPDDEATTVEDLPTEPPEEDGEGGLGWLPIVIGAVVLAGLGGLLATRRRPVPDPNAGDGTGLGSAPEDDR